MHTLLLFPQESQIENENLANTKDVPLEQIEVLWVVFCNHRHCSVIINHKRIL